MTPRSSVSDQNKVGADSSLIQLAALRSPSPSALFPEIPLIEIPDNNPPAGKQSYMLYSGSRHEFQAHVGDDVRVFEISFRFSDDGTGTFAARANSLDSGDTLKIVALFFLRDDGTQLYRFPKLWEIGGPAPFLERDVPQREGGKDSHVYLEQGYTFTKELYGAIRKVAWWAEG